MHFLTLLWDELCHRLGLDDRLEQFKHWLVRDETKLQRRLALATALLTLSLLIALLTQCSGGPQIQP